MTGKHGSLLTRKNSREFGNRDERSSVNSQPAIVDLAELLDQVAVFRDRSHAGEILAGMLDSFRNTEAIVLAIPAGGKITTLLVAIDLCLPAIGFASPRRAGHSHGTVECLQRMRRRKGPV